MRLLFLILTLGFLIRLYAVLESTWIPASDQRDYYILAKNLYDGEGYIQIYHGESEHYEGMTLRAYRSPGLPIFLSSLFRIFSPTPLTGLLGNVFLDTATLFLLMLISRSFFGIKAAVVTGVLYACNFLWTPLLMTEPLFTLLFISTVYTSYKVRSPTYITLLAFGALVTAAVFVRPIGIVLIPFLAIQWGLRPRGVAILLVPLICITSIWTYRNFLLFNELVPMTTNFGAHNAIDFGVDKSSLIMTLRNENKNEAQINNELTRRIIQNIGQDIPVFVKTYYSRVRNLIISPSVSEVSSLLLKSVHRNVILKGFITLWVAILPYLLATSLLVCVIQCFFNSRRREHISLALLSSSFIILHGFISNGNLRFAAPLTSLLMVYLGSFWGVKRQG